MSPLKSRALLTFAALLLTASAVLAGDVYLGITMSPISSSMARALQLDEDEGVLIDEIVADSPADEAGLEAGDVIVAIDDREIAGLKGLSKTIRRYEPGDEVTITVLRAGKRRDLKVTLSEKKQKSFTVWSDGDETKVFSWNSGDDDENTVVHEGKVYRFPGGDNEFVIKSLRMNERGFLGIIPGSRKGTDGVLIEELVEDGPAEKAGLLGGDLIVALDDVSIASGRDLHEFLAETKPGQDVSVRVARSSGEQSFDVTLTDLPSQLKLADVYVPGQSAQSWISLDTMPMDDVDDFEEERQEVQEMRNELEELKAELEALRKELEKKK